MKKIEINTDEFVAICMDADSMADAARKTGMHPTTFRRKAKELGCYKPNQTNRPKYIPHSLTKDDVRYFYLSNRKVIAPSRLKQLLFKHEFKEKVCELCGLSEWLGADIPLELHHRDGDRYNNSIDNLLILCPTCHSWISEGNNNKTEDETGRVEYVACIKKTKSRHKEPITYEHVCPSCGKQYTTTNYNQKYCSHVCAGKTYRKFDLTAEYLLGMFREEANYTKIAEKLGVSDNAVKKRCKVLGIYDEVKTLVAEEKRRRAIKNQCSQSREFRQASVAKSKVTVNRNMDYYVGYTVVNGAEVELVRFENTEQLRNAGYSDSVVQRVCRGEAKTYKGWLWRREPKVSCG